MQESIGLTLYYSLPDSRAQQLFKTLQDPEVGLLPYPVPNNFNYSFQSQGNPVFSHYQNEFLTYILYPEDSKLRTLPSYLKEDQESLTRVCESFHKKTYNDK